MSRIDRKSLKGPDAFQRETVYAARWLTTHWPAAVGAVVVVVGLLAGGALWRADTERREADAAARLAAAIRLFEGAESAGQAGDAALSATAALPLLRDVATTFRGTNAGATAQLYVAHALLRAGDPKGAEEAYGAALAAAPHELAREAARYGLGHARVAQGNAEGAIEAWRPLTERAGPYQGLAWLDLARAQETLGRMEEARKAYVAGKEALRDGPRLGALAEERLAELGGAPVRAAPAPAPSPAAR